MNVSDESFLDSLVAGAHKPLGRPRRIVLFANSDWYLFNFRLSLALSLIEAGYEVLLVSPGGPYGDKLTSMGLKWRRAPMERRSLNPFRESALILWLRRLIEFENIDLVHGFTIKCAIYGALAARLARRPRGKVASVSSIAGMGYVFTNGGLLARALRPLVIAFMRGVLDTDRSVVIVQNRDDLRFLIDAGIIQESRLRLVRGSGVDCVRFSPSFKSRTTASSSLRVVLPARILWDKGIGEFVQAARLLRAEGRELDFVLAGSLDEGNPASVPSGTVQRWVQEGSVAWIGHVDNMPALFSTTDIVVLPSYREGLPKGLIEAAACALPIVATDVPGCREVVNDGENGLLVPARDVRSLASAIARLHDDAMLRERLGESAMRKARIEFAESVVNGQTTRLYHQLLA